MCVIKLPVLLQQSVVYMSSQPFDISKIVTPGLCLGRALIHQTSIHSVLAPNCLPTEVEHAA